MFPGAEKCWFCGYGGLKGVKRIIASAIDWADMFFVPAFNPERGRVSSDPRLLIFVSFNFDRIV